MDKNLSAFVMVFLFGATTMPIYSICATHANDFAAKRDLVDLSASLIMLYSIGAIISPIVSGYLIEMFGAGSMFIYIGFIHSFLVIYSVWRMSIRPAVSSSDYRYIPRTTMFINIFCVIRVTVNNSKTLIESTYATSGFP